MVLPNYVHSIMWFSSNTSIYSKPKVSAHSFHIINKPLPNVTTDRIYQHRTVHDDAAQPFRICQQLCRVIRYYTQKDLLNAVNISLSNRLQPGTVKKSSGATLQSKHVSEIALLLNLERLDCRMYDPVRSLALI